MGRGAPMIVRRIRAQDEMLAGKRRELGDRSAAGLRKRDMQGRQDELQDERKRAHEQRKGRRAGRRAFAAYGIADLSLHRAVRAASILPIIGVSC
jgi:hypothetical protein